MKILKTHRPDYRAIHYWIRKRLPKPDLCVNCHIRPAREIANISQEYKWDVNDFEWLCRSCHIRKENRYANNGHYVRTEENKRLMADIFRGRIIPEEVKEKMSKAAKKRVLTSVRNRLGRFI
jgi:uncharacterized protein YuzB (UPF0349 family)